MKKHLIALAVASAVSVPAMAQVTLGGLIDTGIGGDSITNGVLTRKTSITGIANRASTSVITFSASEDLGGGMKASFFTNPALSTQTGVFAARDIYASLSGNFGDIRLGRFVPAFETVTGAYSQGGGTSLTAGTADFIFGSTAAANGAGLETASTRVNYTEIGRGAAGGGALQYTSPNMSGLTMMVGVANTINDTSQTVNTTGGRQTEGALNFVSGPISVGAAILNHVSTTEGTAADTDVDLFSIGASVNLDGIVLRVGHVAREEKANGAANPTVDADVTSIGVTIPLSGAASVYATTFTGSDSADGVAANQRDQTGYQLGFQYNLSKRTNLYAIYGLNEFEGPSVATTSKITGTSLGLRHSF